jgi:beta-lactamase class D
MQEEVPAKIGEIIFAKKQKTKKFNAESIFEIAKMLHGKDLNYAKCAKTVVLDFVKKYPEFSKKKVSLLIKQISKPGYVVSYKIFKLLVSKKT